MTIEKLEALGATITFIEIWIKLLDDNYGARRVVYSTAMKYTFNRIPTNMNKPLSSKQKVHKLMTEIGSGWRI